MNGLRVVPLGLRRMVMNAPGAAAACALLRPHDVVPIHYRVTANRGRQHLIRSERSPEPFVAAMQALAPATKECVLEPGVELAVDRQAAPARVGRHGVQGGGRAL